MASLGSLVVQLAADTAKFQGDLGRAAAVAESRMKNIKDSAQRSLGAITVIAAAAGTALVASLKSAIDRADNFRDLAQTVGLSVESLSRLDFAAKQSGVATETLATGIKILSSNLQAAASGNDAAVAKFSALGVSIRDSNGAIKSADQILREAAGKFATFRDGAEKTALAIDLFGKSGADLIPLLNEGADGIEAMSKRADELGVTLSSATAAAADQFNDKIGELRASVTGFQNRLAAALLPSLNAVTESMSKTTGGTESLDRAVRAAAAGVRLLFTGFTFVKELFSQVGDALGALAAALVQVAQGNFRQAFDIMADRIKTSTEDWKKFGETVSAIWNETGDTVKKNAPETGRKIAAPIIEAHRIASETSRKITSDFFEWLQEHQRMIDGWHSENKKNVDTWVDKMDKEFKEKAKKPVDQLSVYAEQAARNMQDAFADFLFDPFEDGLKGMLKSFIDTIRRMVAEQAAAMIFTSKKQGGFGLGDIISAGLGGLFGGGGAGAGTSVATPSYVPEMATGTNYVPRDNFPALLHKGEAVVPARYNPSAGGGMGGGVVINNHVDARGATPDAIAMLPEVLRRNNEHLESKIIDGLRRRKYALG